METSRQSDCEQTKKWTGLRCLIPSLLLATLIADLALRFIPYDRVFYHAWEAAILFATAEGSFARNFRYVSDHSYGDLANLGNRPHFRHYYKEVFTTDEFGFRNSPSTGVDEAPAAILIGDSFAVGASNSDLDTLSAQLTSRLMDRWVYNGGSARPQWKMTEDLIDRLHMHGGLVIWQVSERVRLPVSVHAESPRSPGVAPFAVPSIGEQRSISHIVNVWTDSFLAYSPLRMFFSSGIRKMENGVWFPNPSENLVAVGNLRNGDSMLFLGSEVDNFYQPKYDSPTYLFEIGALVRCTGNEFLVLLVPDKYGVYYPLLRDERRPPPEGESHLNRLEKNLRRLGVPVVNLMSPLRSQAAEDLQSREYNYRLDDTHWNRAGIQTAATEVLRAWGNLPGSIGNAPIHPKACPAVQ